MAHVPAVIKAAHAIYEFQWSIATRSALVAMARDADRDAAHPMYPIGSNAVEPSTRAVTLALSAGGTGDGARTLSGAPLRRLTHSRANRRKGIDVMLDLVEQRAPQGFSNLEEVLPTTELNEIVADYKKLVSQDRETLLRMAGRA